MMMKQRILKRIKNNLLLLFLASTQILIAQSKISIDTIIMNSRPYYRLYHASRFFIELEDSNSKYIRFEKYTIINKDTTALTFDSYKNAKRRKARNIIGDYERALIYSLDNLNYCNDGTYLIVFTIGTIDIDYFRNHGWRSGILSNHNTKSFIHYINSGNIRNITEKEYIQLLTP